MDNDSAISTSEINNFLVRRLGEKEAAEIMEYIQSEIDNQVLAKGEETKNEIILWRNEMKSEFATKADAGSLEKKLIKRISAIEGPLFYGHLFFGLHLY
jgi:hypothetical protein